MKLQHINTVVKFTDEETNNVWTATFTGTHTDLYCQVLKNNKHVNSYKVDSGHANKTVALKIVINAGK